MPRNATPLRLSALDENDLQTISATLQDAVAQLGDFEFSKSACTFTLALNRFRWEGGGRKERVRTGLQFARVLSAKAHKLRQGADEAVVNLLSIGFEAGNAPSGDIILVFSGGGELRLGVECVEAVMVDISAPWPASSRPEHEAE